MNIEYWDGISNFQPGQTPFGLYDNEPQFKTDVDKVSVWAGKRLGFPIVDVELTSGSFYAAFEEAITVYSNEIYQYKIRENYGTLEGTKADLTQPINNSVVTQGLGLAIRTGQSYASEAGIGGKVTYKKGYIDLVEGQQSYDLTEWAVNSGITSSIEIKRIFFENTPASARYYDPYAGSFGNQMLNETFGIANGGTAAMSSLLMPLNYDVMRAQHIEFADDIRRSAYSFDLINNQLRLFPIPTREKRLYFDYIEDDERNEANINDGSNNGGPGDNLITDISKVPYTNPVYSKINSVGKQFINHYMLSIAKEMLGYIRKKYNVIPIPDAEVQLNGDDLIQAAQTEKEALITQLRATLEETSRKNQLIKQKEEMDATKDTLANIPMPFYIF